MRILNLVAPVGPLVMMLVKMLSDVLRWVALSSVAIVAFGAGLFRIMNDGVEVLPDCDDFQVHAVYKHVR